MPRLLLLAALALAACGPNPAATPPSPAPADSPASRPADDLVVLSAGAADSLFVLDNDPAGVRLTGIGEPTGGTFGVPGDGLARGIVTVEAPASGESSVWYYVAGPDGTRDSARVVVRVE